MPFQPYGQLVPSVVPGRLSMLRRVPAGVIGAITPWNSPTVLGMRVVAPALALGNAVILKPDPQTPVCGGAMFEAVFREAGLPEGLLHVVLGGADVGEAIVTDPQRDAGLVHRVDRGRAAGSGRSPGERLKRASLELGGNNAFVVLDDADLEAAASAGAFASFQFQGQVCFATGRHIVHRSIAAAYIDLLAEKATRLRLGDPYREDVDLGPIVNQKQVERVDGIVRRSVDAGARVVVGGTHEGLFYRPTVLTDVTADQAAWREEIFGPVAPVVVFDTDEEALALANDSEYGLTGAVYSRSISRGLALAQRFRSGMVHVNDQTVNDEATIPFGGMGASGNGAASAARPTGTSSASGSGSPCATIPSRTRTRTEPRRWHRSPRSHASPACRRPPRRASSPRRTTRSARRRGSACSRRRGRSTTCPTRWPAGCSRARCRSWRSSSTTSPTRTSRRSSAGSRTARRPPATS